MPLEWGLGFAGTLSMLGIAYSLLNERTAWVAAIVSAAAAVAAFSLPLKLNILVAIAAAVAATLVMTQAGKATAGDATGGAAMSGTMPGWAWTALTILGLGAVTAISRNVFLWSRRELRMPEPLQRALQMAPLAAIVAITAPEIFLSQGHLIETWRDARLLVGGGGDRGLRLAAGRARAAARRPGGVPAAAPRLGLVSAPLSPRRHRPARLRISSAA